MKRFSMIVFCMLLLALVVGCSGKSDSSSTSSSESSSSSSIAASDGAEESEEDPTATSSVSKEDKKGFDRKTNYTIVIAGVEFQIPSYYEQGKANTNDAGATSTVYTAESLKESAVLLLSIEQPGPGVTSDNFENAKDNVMNALASLNVDDGSSTITEKADADIAGMKGRAFTVRAKFSGADVEEHWIIFWNDESKCFGGLSYYEYGNSEYDYYPDYRRIVDSAHATESPSTADSGSAESESGEVSPDLKEALDSYEAFVDEYVEFMQKYQESGDTMSMLSDYSNYMQKYLDFAQKIEAMDTSNMSAADYAYYIEVTSKVSEKLLKVSGII